jgi:hypothetical protein
MGFLKEFLVDRDHYADESSWHSAMEAFNRKAREAAEARAVPFVDQASAYAGRRDFFIDPVHMTQQGVDLKTRLFFEKIVALSLIR